MIEVLGRASKSCNHAIARLHKISEKLRKIWANEFKTGKTGTYFIVLSQSDNKIYFLWHFSPISLRKNLVPENCGCAKEFTLRKSCFSLQE